MAGTLQATVMLQAQAIAAQGVTDLDNYLQAGEAARDVPWHSDYSG